jgi:hypothetical protein
MTRLLVLLSLLSLVLAQFGGGDAQAQFGGSNGDFERDDTDHRHADGDPAELLVFFCILVGGIVVIAISVSVLACQSPQAKNARQERIQLRLKKATSFRHINKAGELRAKAWFDQNSVRSDFTFSLKVKASEETGEFEISVAGKDDLGDFVGSGYGAIIDNMLMLLFSKQYVNGKGKQKQTPASKWQLEYDGEGKVDGKLDGVWEYLDKGSQWSGTFGIDHFVPPFSSLLK